MPAKAMLDDDKRKQEIIRMLSHSGAYLKDHTLDIRDGYQAQVTVTFYITQEALNAAINPTHEFSETSEPGADFYRRLAGHKGK